MSTVIVTPAFIDLASRALLNHILDHADIVGQDTSGHPVMCFEFACAPWLMDKLAAFGSADEDLEPEPDEAA